MATTKFSPGTVVQSTWLNDVDSASFPYLTAVTGTNTITATGPQSYVAYTQSQGGFVIVPQASNTGAVTININGLGAKAITKYGTSPLVASDLAVGVVAYIVYDGTQFQLLNPQTVAARITGRLLNVQIFTSNGTYTPIAGTNSIIVEAVGGGGAGGGAGPTGAGQSWVGGGGGAGAYMRARITTGFSGAAVVIGSGGTGVAGAAGNNGTATTFGGTLVVCDGGQGGASSALSVPPATLGFSGAGGATATTTGQPIAGIGGAAGDFGMSVAPGGGSSGNGGNSFFGGGGVRTFQNNGVPASVASGSGGGGAHNPQNDANNRPGGNGATGRVIIYEYS